MRFRELHLRADIATPAGVDSRHEDVSFLLWSRHLVCPGRGGWQLEGAMPTRNGDLIPFPVATLVLDCSPNNTKSNTHPLLHRNKFEQSCYQHAPCIP